MCGTRSWQRLRTHRRVAVFTRWTDGACRCTVKRVVAGWARNLDVLVTASTVVAYSIPRIKVKGTYLDYKGGKSVAYHFRSQRHRRGKNQRNSRSKMSHMPSGRPSRGLVRPR